MEEWRDIPGHEGRYQASSLGRIRSLIIGEPLVLKTMSQRNGYRRVFLFHPVEKKIECFVHRLVAIPFLSNPGARPFVNHKNCDKADNRLVNLEWATVAENTQHYYASRRLVAVAVCPDIEIDPADIPF